MKYTNLIVINTVSLDIKLIFHPDFLILHELRLKI